MGNCPNCGAVITGTKCEYCGTVFDRNGNAEVNTSPFNIVKAISDFANVAHNFGGTIGQKL